MYPGAPEVSFGGLDNDCVPTTLEGGGATVGGLPVADLAAAFAAAVPGSTIEACEGQHLDAVVTLDGCLVSNNEATFSFADGGGGALRRLHGDVPVAG